MFIILIYDTKSENANYNVFLRISCDILKNLNDMNIKIIYYTVGHIRMYLYVFFLNF